MLAPRRAAMVRGLASMVLLLAGLAPTSQADEPRTWGARAAVLRFTGPGAVVVERDVGQRLGEHAALVPYVRWQKVERRLVRGLRDPLHMATVAAALEVDVVVMGAILRDAGRWQLRIALRDGATGHIRERLQYPLRTPKVDPKTRALLHSELAEAFERTLTTAHQGRVAAKPKPPPAPVDETGDDTMVTAAPAATPVAPAPPSATATAPPPRTNEVVVKATPSRSAPTTTTTAPKPVAGRPDWAPYFEFAVGPLLSSRKLDFSPASQPRFVPGLAEGLHVDLTIYPFAGSYERYRGVFATLGFGVTLDKPFWSDSEARSDPNYRLATTELRVEGGLRWRFVLRRLRPRVELTTLIGAGLHSFAIAKLTDGSDAGPPDVAYRYVALGVGLRIWPVRRLALEVYGSYEPVFDAGPIATPEEFGAAMSWAVRTELRLRVRVWRGFNLGVAGYYERFSSTFTAPVTATNDVANAAVDQLYGAAFLVGWDY